MSFQRSAVAAEHRERRLRMEAVLSNTTCSKGHTHPPWNTRGVLRIAKCESMCGFCQKETKTAANLRKHVAIHIKNERLNLTIAEGSSGRGRLEMPPSFDGESSPSSQSSHLSGEVDVTLTSRRREHTSTSRKRFSQPLIGEPYASSTARMPIHRSNSHASISSAVYPPSSNANAPFIPATDPQSMASTTVPSYQYPYVPTLGAPPTPPTSSLPMTTRQQSYTTPLDTLYPNPAVETDAFSTLRRHKIRTKTAWTAIPASEGMRILDLCKSLSVAPPEGSSSANSQLRTPCYNRQTLFDEEWQAHMRDVHGVFLLWPQTWMKRIEVLDLEPYGGDIGGVNDLIMAD